MKKKNEVKKDFMYWWHFGLGLTFGIISVLFVWTASCDGVWNYDKLIVGLLCMIIMELEFWLDRRER